MNYTSLTIQCDESLSEIMIAELSDFPFDSFTYEDQSLVAYLPTESLAANRSAIEQLLQRYHLTGSWLEIETQNWNTQWEQSLQCVSIEGRLMIRAPYHDPAPEGMMDVVLNPQMSFGTGHHATTWMMSHALLDLGVEHRTGLDIGCGTGVLAIVAAKCGAAHVDAVDIDDLCVKSCHENSRMNHVEERITEYLGDVRIVGERSYDFIVENIHRNILIAQMQHVAALLVKGGDLLMSGFWEEDVAPIVEAAEKAGLHLVGTDQREEWRMIHVRK